MFLLGLSGIDSLDALTAWIGGRVEVEAETLPALPPGEFYQFEALGMEVRTRDGIVIGQVAEVITAEAHDVWVVRPEHSGSDRPREFLIPVVGQIVPEIDLARRVAIVDPLPGLLDD